MIKSEQSKLPPDDVSQHKDVFKVACYCPKCKWHLDLLVDQRDDGASTLPCRLSSSEYPLHHFILTGDGQEEHLQSHDDQTRTYKFHCSAPRCPVTVTIHMRPAFLKLEWIDLLTDKIHLRQRWEAAKQEVGGRAEGPMARPVDGLDFLGTYLTDSLNPQQGKTKIPLLNRKFLKTFGRDCDEMFTALGFTLDSEKHEDGSCTEFWHLPTPPPAKDPLDPPAQRTCVEDSKHELVSHLLGYPETERQHLRRPVLQPQSAKRMIEQAVHCEDCRQTLAALLFTES